jgi:hypothetical protein
MRSTSVMSRLDAGRVFFMLCFHEVNEIHKQYMKHRQPSSLKLLNIHRLHLVLRILHELLSCEFKFGSCRSEAILILNDADAELNQLKKLGYVRTT